MTNFIFTIGIFRTSLTVRNIADCRTGASGRKLARMFCFGVMSAYVFDNAS